MKNSEPIKLEVQNPREMLAIGLYTTDGLNLRNFQKPEIPEDMPEDEASLERRHADGDALTKTRKKLVGAVAIAGAGAGTYISYKNGIDDLWKSLAAPAFIYWQSTKAFERGVNYFRKSNQEIPEDIENIKRLQRVRSVGIAGVAGAISFIAQDVLPVGSSSNVSGWENWIIPSAMQAANYNVTLGAAAIMRARIKYRHQQEDAA